MKALRFLTLILFLFAVNKGNAQLSWYKQYSGTLDKYPITLHLYKIKNDYQGYYYYNSQEEPIELGGQLSRGRLKLAIYTPSDEVESFEGVLTDKAFNGTWTNTKKRLNFKLTLVPQGEISFDYVFVTGNKKIKKTDEVERDELLYTASSVWPAKGDPDNFLKQVIRKEFGEEKDTASIGKILLRKKNSFLKATGEIDAYEETERLEIAYQDKNILSFSHYNYTDMGGAHGMQGTDYFNVDLQNKRRLVLADIFDTLTIKPFISGILEKYFRQKYKLAKKDPLEETLLVEKIPITDNILVTGKGINFNYVPYEIGAYAMGDILIFIPYKEFEGFLKPAFRKLIGL